MNYFGNFGAECYFLEIEYSKFSFHQTSGCQCNLPFFFFSFFFLNLFKLNNNLFLFLQLVNGLMSSLFINSTRAML